MGFLRKIAKKVKKGVKKVVKGVKKVFKKITKSKLLKTIALVGAGIVTGGAAIGAFGGSLASSSIGSALVSASNAILATPVIGTLATPFKYVGTAIGTGAGKVTDFIGLTSEAGRLNLDKIAFDPVNKGYLNIETGQPLTSTQVANLPSAFKDTAQVSGSYLDSNNKIVRAGERVDIPQQTGFFDTGVGQVIRDAGINYIESQLQPEPEIYGSGTPAGRETTFGIDMQPLQIARAEAADLGGIYSNMQFGTGDMGYLASDLFRQETLGVT